MPKASNPTSANEARNPGDQLQLFHRLTILDWLPDETLHSLVARLHRLSGFRRESITTGLLFGHARSGLRHDFQHGVSEFELRTGGQLGDTEQILLNHTILPLFLCFNTRDFSRQLIRSLSDNYWQLPASGRPFITGRTRGNQPLKACPRCLKADHEKFGVSYWHRCHQFPGVWLCITHNTLLMTYPISALQSSKYALRLPKLIDLQCPATGGIADAAIVTRNTLLEEIRDGVLSAAANFEALQVEPSLLIDLFRFGAYEKGLCASNGRLRTSLAGDSLRTFIAPIADFPDITAFIGDARTTASELARTLRTPARRSHPVRYILISIWLFGSWRVFLERLERANKNHK